MDRNKAVRAVKDAIGGRQTFFGNVDVIVVNNKKFYTYSDIFARVSYNAGYMQMEVDFEWDDDKTQVSYKKLGLHLGYNSNFQDFSFDGAYLQLEDGKNNISVRFKNE